ncbi:phosphotransferase [Nesterenkonia flava]|uniref:Phosphotransferase n=1 Tax=Nesterenkonia flava TaxID=469799 RepID=A0ABU1FQX2_9MICC|nr:phosphotransferase [Nesterenkonia flava]MDR5711044.1 phosphotransferase [Nesterenkonia flava]
MNFAVEEFLRSDDAGWVLQPALASAGLPLDAWQLERVYTRPGAETSAKYLVEADGHTLRLIASTAQLSDTDRQALGAVRCESSVGTLHLWAHPADPHLPGLRIAEDPAVLGERLAASGLLTRGSTAATPQDLHARGWQVASTDLRVLSPLRRAVYRVDLVLEPSGAGQPAPREHLFLKVVRPAKVAELLDRYRASPLTPAFTDLGDGIIALRAAEGAALAEHLYLPSRPPQAAPLDASLIPGATGGLSRRALQLRPRTPVAQRLGTFIGPAAASGAPRERLMDLLASIRAHLRPEPGPVVPVHGDFHPANLFLAADASEVTALIDADTVGPGYAADDAAVMMAHLCLLPSFDAAGYAPVPHFARTLWDLLVQEHEAEDLGARSAGVVLSLLPGARTLAQQEHYLRAAEALAVQEMDCVFGPGE